MIRIINEDFVTWEPLVMRFIPSRKLRLAESRRIARFIQNWFDAAADVRPVVWRAAKEWNCEVSSGNIVAQCEFFPEKELLRLARALGKEFPTLKEIRLGHPLDAPETIANFNWFLVEAAEIQVGKRRFSVKPFQISFSPVSVGQFEEFIAATGYEPVPDKIEGKRNFVIDHFKLNFGRSPKHPLCGVTHDDAVAFCNWAKLRLPSDAELKHFFHSACLNSQKIDFLAECWTSTAVGKDKYVAWNGPYKEEGLKDSEEFHRKPLHRHQYEFLEAPCFRVVKEL